MATVSPDAAPAGELKIVQEIGFSLVQGYFFGRPGELTQEMGNQPFPQPDVKETSTGVV